MEQQKPENAALSITGKVPVAADKNAPPVAASKKKSGGAMHLIKVALFMLRRRPSKSKPVEMVASRGTLNRLVGSMRPLHLQSGSPRHSTNSNNSIDQKQPYYDGVILASTQQQPMSPAASSASSSSSSAGGMSRYASVGNLTELESRYASAVNLRDLDSSCEDEDEDEDSEYGYDENGGDEMIDVKAEEFIAHFYAQMRLQRMNSIDRRYNEMIERSIS